MLVAPNPSRPPSGAARESTHRHPGSRQAHESVPVVKASHAPAGSAPAADRGVVGNLMSMIEGELAGTLIRFADLVDDSLTSRSLDRTLGDVNRREASWREAALLARHGAEAARSLVELAGLFPGEQLALDDHIKLDDLVRDVARRTGPRDAPRRHGVFIDVRSDESPVVHGSRRWLEAAVAKLLQLLAAEAPADAPVVFTLSTSGAHRVLTGTASPGGLPRGQEIAFDRESDPSAADRTAQLNPALMHRIVELHGGVLELRTDPAGVVLDFALTLPATPPDRQSTCMHRADCSVQRQAEMFARDIGMMLTTLDARLRKEKR